ncbi:MAG TPA: DUF4040 domain-containing protein [Pseudomonas xinjiangensis]|uniref:DUF4040 domain-containing protein n=2 Tax=root TaxID=1 RepID=A0A7V1BPC6_9GAMM|nr:DUF4040 domain-containing protein [Halopseudomonas xinjiangensis]HEC48140.1 DUF4040 domain-containing protein [Halopseudomonas xinjiangensis]
MPGAELAFDLLLGTLLVTLAVAALHAPRLYTCVVLFIAFGLLLAITWARLGAPDLALAEAAIGAGLTGVLFLTALSHSGPEPAPPTRPLQMLGAALLAGMLLSTLWLALWPLQHGASAVPDLVAQHLADSGADHPVTAVLLNFRAWDTLLELVVLLLALLGVRQLRPEPRALPPSWPILIAWMRFLAPLSVVMAGYLLWRGSHAPGGAFQAGALLAAGAIALRLSELLPPLRWEQPLMRGLVVVGVLVFLAVAIAGVWLGDGWLVYPREWNSALMILIEVAATLSIATSLTLLVVGDKRELGN